MALPCPKLPKEVLHHIFTLLESDEKTLLQLQLTCKEWAQVAKGIFYKSVDVYNNALKANSLKRALQTPGNSAAHCIRHFRYSASALQDGTSLSSIVSYCPNLQSIKQYTFEFRHNYYPELLALRHQGHLQHLEQVDKPPLRPNAEAANADYVRLMLASSESITKLYLCNPSSDESSDFALTEHLATFSHLKEVEIFKWSGITIHQLSAMLNSSPSCQKIVVKSLLFPEEDPEANDDGNSSCAGVPVLPQVKAAELQLGLLSVKDILVIKHVLPCLNELHIYAQELNPLASEISQLGRFEELLQYVSHIDSFTIGRLEVSAELMIALLVNAQNHLQIDRITVTIDPSEDREGYGFCLSTTDMAENAIKSSTKGSKPNCQIELKVPVKQVTADFCQHLFGHIAKKVQPLSVILHGVYGDEDLRENKILGDCVDYMLVHCKSLKELELSHVRLSSYSHFRQCDKLDECPMDNTYLTDISMMIANVDKMTLSKDEFLVVGYSIDMPNTVIRTLHLVDIRTDGVFKVETGLGAICYYRYSCRNVDNKYEKLTKKEFKQLKQLPCNYYSMVEFPPIVLKISVFDISKILCGSSKVHLNILKDVVE
ncbi:hypothetical protein MBANPS3_007414 [Mucor bainieri]